MFTIVVEQHEINNKKLLNAEHQSYLFFKLQNFAIIHKLREEQIRPMLENRIIYSKWAGNTTYIFFEIYYYCVL